MQNIKEKISRYFQTMDYVLLILALCCSAFGLVLIFSATHAMNDGSTRYMAIQSLAIVLGLAGFTVISSIDLERFTPMWRLVFLINVLFQLSLVIFGYENGGNKSWLRFGGIGIQPAELGKLLFIFTFAKHINLLRYRLNRVKSLVQLGVHLLVIMAAIILPSKDVGMSLPYVFIAVLMLFAAGLSLKWFAGGAILACAAVPILWQILNDVQRDRILVLFDPSIAPDTYWQQQQSRIAIGAGKLFGAGFLKGSQTQNNMLPEKQTDFIFGVAGEEWGLLGCMMIVIALIALIFRVFYVAFHAPSQISSLLCVGIGSMLLFQTFENIFMCLGIGPVMGLTLPFFSYGGSSIVTMFLALGIVVGVSRKSQQRKMAGLPASETIVMEEETDKKKFRVNRGFFRELRSLLADDPEEQKEKRRITVEWLPKRKKKNPEKENDHMDSSHGTDKR
ncbi:MAG: rod shape-determining protein RodA [Clostridia bacterium]|nr:rod shape-determining protein RodA [Clostridia bacterium]